MSLSVVLFRLYRLGDGSIRVYAIRAQASAALNICIASFGPDRPQWPGHASHSESSSMTACSAFEMRNSGDVLDALVVPSVVGLVL